MTRYKNPRDIDNDENRYQHLLALDLGGQEKEQEKQTSREDLGSKDGENPKTKASIPRYEAPSTAGDKGMNKTQKKVLIGGLLVVVAMVVYPPWVGTQVGWNRSPGKTEYHLLIAEVSSSSRGFEIDLKRLFLQVFAVGILTAAGYVLVGGRKAGQVEDAEPKDDPPPN